MAQVRRRDRSEKERREEAKSNGMPRDARARVSDQRTLCSAKWPRRCEDIKCHRLNAGMREKIQHFTPLEPS